jgi:hypothetical protein
VARPGSNAPPVNGGQIRDTLFCRVVPWPVPGYDPQQVDDLCRRVAAELDAGGSARPLIENAAFRRRINGLRYDIDAVDWFLDQFLSPPGHPELGAIAEDPWGDLPVVRIAQRTSEKYAFELQCDSAWRDFGQVPGTHLWFGKVARGLTELRTAEQQTLASVRGSWREAFSAGGRSFTLHRPSGSSSPAVAEFLARAARDDVGHYAENTRTRNFRADQGFESDISLFLCELVDETGTPVLHTTGRNSTWRACACILFPDQRRLRFLVRGSVPANAIMTAVDQAGNKVARYRYIAKSGRQIKHSSRGPAEIIVHPSQKLTDELALALTLSANWFGQYFSSPSG